MTLSAGDGLHAAHLVREAIHRLVHTAAQVYKALAPNRRNNVRGRRLPSIFRRLRKAQRVTALNNFRPTV